MMRREAPGQLVMLTGLASTRELVEPQRRAFGPAMWCPTWPGTTDEEPLSSYARRWGHRIKPRLDPERPTFLAGLSFGGLVAMEMAAVLQPRAVILIASYRSARLMPRHVRLAAAVLGRMPGLLAQGLIPLSAWALARWEGLCERKRRLVVESTRGSVATRLWGMRNIRRWDFDERYAEALPPIRQIHGGRDRLLPSPEGVDQVIEDGGHLINFTHAERVNRFILETMQRCGV